ncbi:hypothetical protein F2P81_001700 [Scophthalmus maximus]|uniref:Uncharacterized protein n=1 Tax=Scophthalmus maximus TaxID=52904 RepID=A0A6A4RMH5_SCOMX|nr:hypothetical protein F2P81_026409 [Scophthalmus maximus]KAF0045171.1 hypothetical protein F2P81_001700 [Scophthalmus maximus]
MKSLNGETACSQESRVVLTKKLDLSSFQTSFASKLKRIWGPSLSMTVEDFATALTQVAVFVFQRVSSLWRTRKDMKQ